MKILNLTDLKKSEIKYEISKFPDGQQQVKILSNVYEQEEIPGSKIIGTTTTEWQTKTILRTFQIKSRLNNFKDLELIICATKSLRNLGVKEIHLYTPYFLGSRSDRQFEEGSNNYLKDVICPIINSLKFESVTVLDPHSDVLEACLTNFKKVNNEKLVSYALENLYCNGTTKDIVYHITKNPDFILVSPDAGANKKIFKVAEQIGYKGEIITCSKSRDVNGKLSNVVIPKFVETNWRKDFIIVDDICDGGKTFIEIAERLKRECPMKFKLPKIYLIITHGIFSKGFKEINQYFDGIYCTNSYRDVADNEYEEVTKVKQLNVF